MTRWQSLVAGLYGLTVIASGLVRYFESADGEKGLWFGIVMGSIALAAAWLFHRNKKVLAEWLMWTCLLVVGGWFVYEALIKKGYAVAEPRMLIVIAITLATSVALLVSVFVAKVEDQQPI